LELWWLTGYSVCDLCGFHRSLAEILAFVSYNTWTDPLQNPYTLTLSPFYLHLIRSLVTYTGERALLNNKE
jgi:hypothetical protein